jgi:gliding motility-associated-like protein
MYGIIQVPGYVKLNVTTPFGCKASDSLMIDAKACCQVFLPNAFTPGAIINNIFRPITNGNRLIHKFMVQNRFGQTVYETCNQNDGWNGQFNGVPQDIGVYFYYLKYDCDGKTLEEKGDVTLIR